jgi:hypothetical protein
MLRAEPNTPKEKKLCTPLVESVLASAHAHDAVIDKRLHTPGINNTFYYLKGKDGAYLLLSLSFKDQPRVTLPDTLIKRIGGIECQDKEGKNYVLEASIIIPHYLEKEKKDEGNY